MLIINADDYGRNEDTTDRILRCFDKGVITSASAMVFMADSARAADLALQRGMETGLHLNLTLPFDGPEVPSQLKEGHRSMAEYLTRAKWAQAVYNPFLRRPLRTVFQAQVEEYLRLFNEAPARIDGHSHMHLCMNMIFGRPISPGVTVRRGFTFERGEKGFFNRTYRKLIDGWLIGRYRCTDSFYSIEPVTDRCRLKKIVESSRISNVELMVHPADDVQFDYIMSPGFRSLVDDVQRGTYSTLSSDRLSKHAFHRGYQQR